MSSILRFSRDLFRPEVLASTALWILTFPSTVVSAAFSTSSPQREILIAFGVVQFFVGWLLVVVLWRLTKHGANRRERPSEDIELQPYRPLPAIDPVETDDDLYAIIDLYAKFPSIEDGDNGLSEE
jgi:hypothetical protein